jgi:hypothetical protein
MIIVKYIRERKTRDTHELIYISLVLRSTHTHTHTRVCVVFVKNPHKPQCHPIRQFWAIMYIFDKERIDREVLPLVHMMEGENEVTNKMLINLV